MADSTVKGPSYTVAKSFRDKDNFAKEHAVGGDVSHFDEERLSHLVSIGHVAVSWPKGQSPQELAAKADADAKAKAKADADAAAATNANQQP